MSRAAVAAMTAYTLELREADIKLNQNETFEARLEQSPRGRETRYTAPNDDNARSLPLVLRRGNAKSVTNSMTDHIGRTNDFTGRQRRATFMQAASSKRRRQTKKRRKHLSPCEAMAAVAIRSHPFRSPMR